MTYPTILYFKSQYCSPCVAVEQMLDEVNVSLFGNRLNVRKIDILKEIELARKYNVLSVPTVIIGKIRLTVVIDKNELTDSILQGFLSSISFEDEIEGGNNDSDMLGTSDAHPNEKENISVIPHNVQIASENDSSIIQDPNSEIEDPEIYKSKIKHTHIKSE